MQYSINNLDKRFIAELKALKSPPEGVIVCCNALCKLFGYKEDWMTAKVLMSDSNFVTKILNYDADKLSMKLVRYIQKKYTQHPENSQYFKPGEMQNKSMAASVFVAWINNLILYRTTLEEMRGGQEPAGQSQEPSNQADV